MTRASPARFALELYPPLKGGVLVLLLFASAGVIALLVGFAKAGDMESGVMSAIFVIAMSVVFVAGAWRMSRGVVEVTDERLELRIPGDQQSIRWTDVVGAQVRTIADLNIFDRILATLAGTHHDRRLIEVRLRRPIRLPFLPWQKAGPDAIGLPSFPMKVLRLYVSEPEGLELAINAQVALGQGE